MRQGLYTLDFALSGKLALDKLDGSVDEDIILLVSDINMPGMSGLDLLPVVKERRPDLPVFMISAYGDANTIAMAMECGPSKAADTFLWHRGGVATRMAKAYRRRWRGWQILSGARGWRKHPTFERFQMVTPCPFLNPSYVR